MTKEMTYRQVPALDQWVWCVVILFSNLVYLCSYILLENVKTNLGIVEPLTKESGPWRRGNTPCGRNQHNVNTPKSPF